MEKFNNEVVLFCEDIDKYRLERDLVSEKLRVVVELIDVDGDVIRNEV